MQSAIGFLLLIGPLIVLHELGHYLVARWFGVKANVFSVGFGKPLFGWTDKRGTRWQLAAIPLGGYVQFAGDLNASSETDDEAISAMRPEERAQTFAAHPLWQRALIVAAGPLTNFLVAIVIFAAFNLAFGKPVVAPLIGQFAEHSPAQAAGLLTDDRIMAVDGRKVDDFNEIIGLVAPYPGRTVLLHVSRAGREFDVSVKLMDYLDRDKFGNESRIGLLGIRSTKGEFRRVGPIESVGLAVTQTGDMVRMLAIGLKQIVTGDRSFKDLGGPIKTAKFSGEQLSLGWLNFTHFVALISINLAFINLLPIPTLDGGHLALYAVEAIRRRPVGARSQEWAFRTGLAFVLVLMLFVTINDVASLLPLR